MYVILVYDISGKRVSKIHKFLKKYLNWVQNSVFEGYLSKSDFIKIKTKLKQIIKRRQNKQKRENIICDSIIIYTIFSQKYLKREIIGKEKSSIDNII